MKVNGIKDEEAIKVDKYINIQRLLSDMNPHQEVAKPSSSSSKHIKLQTANVRESRLQKLLLENLRQSAPSNILPLRRESIDSLQRGSIVIAGSSQSPGHRTATSSVDFQHIEHVLSVRPLEACSRTNSLGINQSSSKLIFLEDH